MRDRIAEQTARGGWVRYEVSAYARPGAQCRHNQNYWEFGDYLGIRTGAHGKLSFHDKIVRKSKLTHPETRMRNPPLRDNSHMAEERIVGTREPALDFMRNAMSLERGVAAATFVERTGLDRL